MKETESTPKTDKREKLDSSVIVVPVGVDLFLGGENGALPKTISGNQEFQKEAKVRRELYISLKDAFEKIGDPRMDICEALRIGRVSTEEAVEIYKKLSDFLETNPNNERLILYLPLSLFPAIKNENVLSVEIADAQREFYEVIKESWPNLLNESDVRASFVDGDVLESGMGKPERVRKVAHLIPFLISAGVVSENEVIEITAKTMIDDDSELVKSLKQGMRAWREMTDKKINDEKSQEDVLRTLEKDLHRISTKLTDGSEYVKKVSKKRVVWERKEKRGLVIDSAARELVEANDFGNLAMETLVKSGLTETEKKSLILKTLLFAVERSQILFDNSSPELVNKLTGLASEWWKEVDENLREEIDCVFLRLKRLGLVNDDVEKKIDIDLIDLRLPFSMNGEKLIAEKYGSLVEAVRIIESDKELGRIICPFFVCIGSQVKGIAGKNSDRDAALFWRPGITSDDREEAIHILAEKCPSIKEIDSMPEIWLAEIKGKIAFRKGIGNLPNSVSPEQIHFILGGLWVGEEGEIKKVAADLTERYVDLNRFGKEKSRARMHLLRRLEMDTLQYRLMHKGFRRSYPQTNDKRKMVEIDFASDFFEPEYRQIATLLFVSRVFLPDLNLGIKKRP